MLQKWAVLDIETTGLDPNYDEIIDVGFLQFEGTKLLRTFSSLVRSGGVVTLPHFIQKLTSITPKMLEGAPQFSVVLPEILDLYGHEILAHNSSFEKSFLENHFEKIADDNPRESFEDSMFILALMFPQKSGLNLEKFIIEWGIRNDEAHRGLEDSLDLLKVILVATEFISENLEKHQTLISLFSKYELVSYWPLNFLTISSEDRHEIADQINFKLDIVLDFVREYEQGKTSQILDSNPWIKTDFSGENIKSIFREESKIKEMLPYYKYRKPQEELALRLGQSFKNKVHSIIQAPTGTGKTLGYMLPVTLFSISEKEQVLIATGTKTLQNQILSKDVPDLLKLTGINSEKIKIKKLIGSNNHFCELIFREENKLRDLSFDEKIAEIYFEMIFFHNSKKTTKEPITRQEIPYVLKRKLSGFERREKEIAVDFRSCTGVKCPFKNDCSYIEGIREAKAANIIIGNHSLMYSWTKSFPRPGFIVVDEAHKLEKETTEAFTFEASQPGLESFQKNLKNLTGIGSLFYLMASRESTPGESTPKINALRENLISLADTMFVSLNDFPRLFENYFKRLPRYTAIYWNESPLIKLNEKSDSLVISISERIFEIYRILFEIKSLLIPYSETFNIYELNDENEIKAITKFNTFMGTLEDIFNAFDFAVNPKDEYVNSMKFHEEFGYLFCSAPVNVGKMVFEGLLSPSQAVVFTSATLGGLGESGGTRGVEWALGHTYISPEKRFKTGLFLDPIYDYEKNAKVFLCDDVPSLGDSEFLFKTLKHVFKLIHKLSGRTLLLFSSKERFETAREMLIAEFEGEIPLFIQGMGIGIVEEFKKSSNGILLGLESFGEGIDVPGDDLVFVFIDKIPDLRMDLVIEERRHFFERNFGNEFSDYYLAHRATSLHQKLGRLLRTENDRGGAIIVDSRAKLWKGRTMEKFLKLMKPYSIKKTSLLSACEELSEFILQPSLKD
jgi:ATP-dependent DNA helicase DinG